jgi:hypothetical protein
MEFYRSFEHQGINLFFFKKRDWKAVFQLIFLHHLALWLHAIDNNFSYTGMDLYQSPEESYDGQTTIEYFLV